MRLEINAERQTAIIWACSDESTDILPPEITAQLEQLRAKNKKFRVIGHALRERRSIRTHAHAAPPKPHEKSTGGRQGGKPAGQACCMNNGQDSLLPIIFYLSSSVLNAV